MSRAWTLIEILVAASLVLLLVAIVIPGVRGAVARARSARCAGNLREMGVLIHGFVQSHGERAAPTVWGHDFHWDREPRLGWDIETGVWARVPGGIGTIWNCPAGGVPYLGNARALGVDERRRQFLPGEKPRTRPRGTIYHVGPRWWHEPSRLVLAVDLQTNLVEPGAPMAHAAEPLIGDLSDELVHGWLRPWDPPFHNLFLDRLGPHHAETYGALFADGHASVKLYVKESEAVLWSGPRWWD
ncbi:MAG: hypothetical protein LC135_07350 [Phycisphaerae bacterium]|nr:hypothetical protein [Phycisphaerae bacterium]MCZ2399668.1 hypothetical protein [Phycisphaerae bacterium]